MGTDFSRPLQLRILMLLLWMTLSFFVMNSFAADTRNPGRFLSDIQLDQDLRAIQEIPSDTTRTRDRARPVDRPSIEQDPGLPRIDRERVRDRGIMDLDRLIGPGVIEEITPVTVPDLKGKTVQQAEMILRRSRLKTGEVKTIQSRENEGIIIRQYPAAKSRAKAGTPVNLYISKAAVADRRELTINIQPAIQTRQQGEIAEFIGRANMTFVTGNGIRNVDLTDNGQISWLWRCGNQTSRNNLFEIDTGKLNAGKHKVVLEVSIQQFSDDLSHAIPTRRNYSKTATLTVNPVLVEIPSVLNMDRETAISTLEKARLSVGDIEVIESDSGRHTVTRQIPEPGKSVRPGSSVRLFITIPRPPDYRLILESNKQSVETDEKVTLMARLKPRPDGRPGYRFYIGEKAYSSNSSEFEYSFNEAGLFRIYAVAELGNGEQVTSERITLRVKPALVAVPSVLHEKLFTAEEILAKSTLSLGQVSRIETGSGKHTISRQTPAAGKMVKPGTAVAVTIAIPMAVPDYRINLHSDRLEIGTGETVTLSVNLSPPAPQVNGYTFVINDEVQSSRHNQLLYTFDKPGAYRVFARTSINNKSVRSEPLTIQVNDTWLNPVAIIKPESVRLQAGDSVTFSSHSQYDKRGGLDTSWSAWNGKNGSKQQFIIATENIQPGQYWITLTITDSRNNTDKTQAMLIIETVPLNWIWWLPVIIGGLGIAGAGYSLIKRRSSSPSVKKLKSTRLSYLTETDFGTQSVSENADDDGATGICIRVETDPGEQNIIVQADKQEQSYG